MQFVPNRDYAEAFWVNMAGGYYTLESNKAIYVIGLDDGVVWGNSGAIMYNNSLSSNVITQTIVPHPTNINIFNLVYTDTSMKNNNKTSNRKPNS